MADAAAAAPPQPQVNPNVINVEVAMNNINRNRNGQNNLVDIRDRLFHAIYFKVALMYAQIFPRSIQRALEFFMLMKALIFFFALVYIHFSFIKNPATCLQNVKDWPRDGVLRVEVVPNLDKRRALQHQIRINEQIISELEKYYFYSTGPQTKDNFYRLRKYETTLKHFGFALKPNAVYSNDSVIHYFKAEPIKPNESLSLELKTEELKNISNALEGEQYVVEYSLEYGHLRLSPMTRQRLQIPVRLVQLDPITNKCFGDKISRFLLSDLLGYDDLLMASVRVIAEKEDNKGFLRNVVTGEHYRFISLWWTAVSSYPIAFVVMLLFTFSISMLLRFSHHQIFVFIVDLLQMLEFNVTARFPIAPLLTVILALVGMEAIMSEFFNDTSTAFYIILIVWFADQFDAICCHTTITKRHWLRFFYIYHFSFYAYHYRFNGQNRTLALLSMWFFVVHSMLYFFHRYELPVIIQQAQVLIIRSRIQNAGAPGIVQAPLDIFRRLAPIQEEQLQLFQRQQQQRLLEQQQQRMQQMQQRHVEQQRLIERRFLHLHSRGMQQQQSQQQQPQQQQQQQQQQPQQQQALGQAQNLSNGQQQHQQQQQTNGISSNQPQLPRVGNSTVPIGFGAFSHLRRILINPSLREPLRVQVRIENSPVLQFNVSQVNPNIPGTSTEPTNAPAATTLANGERESVESPSNESVNTTPPTNASGIVTNAPGNDEGVNLEDVQKQNTISANNLAEAPENVRNNKMENEATSQEKTLNFEQNNHKSLSENIKKDVNDENAKRNIAIETESATKSTPTIAANENNEGKNNFQLLENEFYAKPIHYEEQEQLQPQSQPQQQQQQQFEQQLNKNQHRQEGYEIKCDEVNPMKITSLAGINQCASTSTTSISSVVSTPSLSLSPTSSSSLSLSSSPSPLPSPSPSPSLSQSSMLEIHLKEKQPKDIQETICQINENDHEMVTRAAAKISPSIPTVTKSTMLPLTATTDATEILSTFTKTNLSETNAQNESFDMIDNDTTNIFKNIDNKISTTTTTSQVKLPTTITTSAITSLTSTAFTEITNATTITTTTTTTTNVSSNCNNSNGVN